jgi:hypothetical protein
MEKNCRLCGRPFWALNGGCMPMSGDGRYCEQCASEACEKQEYTPGPVSFEDMRDLLMQHRLVQAAAFLDPEGYDEGRTLSSTSAMVDVLNARLLERAKVPA